MYKLRDFIDITEVNSTNPDILDAIAICKRKGNAKRDFLFVNRHQGKHIPVSPKVIFSMYEELATHANQVFAGQKIALVGFAETATAIGHYMASAMPGCTYAIRTTREIHPTLQPLIEFREEHSHAPAQLVYGDLDLLLACDRIVFVEDEITTGNTILNFIEAFNRFRDDFSYGLISILNWQSPADALRFQQKNIPTVCLLRGEVRSSEVQLPSVTVTELEVSLPGDLVHRDRMGSQSFVAHGTMRDTLGTAVLKAMGSELENAISNTNVAIGASQDHQVKTILVLGTEEFMMMPMLIADFFGQYDTLDVLYHATTRSPITPSLAHGDYAVTCVDALISPYGDRETFIYNLKKYDKVIVVTEASDGTGEFKRTVLNALERHGNTDVTFIRLIDSEC